MLALHRVTAYRTVVQVYNRHSSSPIPLIIFVDTTPNLQHALRRVAYTSQIHVNHRAVTVPLPQCMSQTFMKK
jgi:hypothetical protein